MVLNRLFSVSALSGVILFFTVCAGCVATATPVSLYKPTAQYQTNLTVDELIERGDAFYFQDDYANAREYYFRALMADPANVDVLNYYAVTLINTHFYENALVILNIASQIDPYDENVRDNILLCRQLIAMRTEEQRLLELEAQQAQQEMFNNLAASLNSLSASLAQVQQNQNRNTGGGTGGSSGDQSAFSGGSSSSRDKNNFDIARAKRSYDRDAKNAESAWKNIKSSGDYSGQQRQTFQQCQSRMRKTREEAARNGHTINKSKWEDERLP